MHLSSEKKFNIFILLSTFARGLVEIYIPIFLYNKGISIHSIFLYFIIKYAIIALTYTPIVYIGKKIKFRWLITLSSLLLGLSFYFLSNMSANINDIIKLAILFALWNNCYWSGRLYYALESLPKKDIGEEVGNIIIFTQLALIPAAYVGALLIETLGTFNLSVLVALLSLLAIIPVFLIKERKQEKVINAIKVIKDIPKKSLLFIAFEQIKVILVLMFPLYVYIYISSDFSYIGLLNIAIGIASMFFVYNFCRIIDKNKKDYTYLSAFLLVLVWLAKLNVATTSLMLIVAILEGLTTKMHETSTTRDIFALGKNYDTCSYIIVFEVFQNIVRVLILTVTYLFINDLKIFLTLATILFLLSAFVKFDDGKGGY
jgi:hypothetical protein